MSILLLIASLMSTTASISTRGDYSMITTEKNFGESENSFAEIQAVKDWENDTYPFMNRIVLHLDPMLEDLASQCGLRLVPFKESKNQVLEKAKDVADIEEVKANPDKPFTYRMWFYNVGFSEPPAHYLAPSGRELMMISKPQLDFVIVDVTFDRFVSEESLEKFKSLIAVQLVKIPFPPNIFYLGIGDSIESEGLTVELRHITEERIQADPEGNYPESAGLLYEIFMKDMFLDITHVYEYLPYPYQSEMGMGYIWQGYAVWLINPSSDGCRVYVISYGNRK